MREAAPFLAEGAVEVASLPYVDPARFEIASSEPNALARARRGDRAGERLADREVRRCGRGFRHRGQGAAGRGGRVAPQDADGRRAPSDDDADAIQSALVANFSFDFRAGQKLRLGLAPDAATGALRPVRVSLYEQRRPHRHRRALRHRHLCRRRRSRPIDDPGSLVAEEEAPKKPSGRASHRLMRACGAPGCRSTCPTS